MITAWVIRRHSSYPDIYPGWNRVSSADFAVLEAAGLAVDTAVVPQRYLPRITTLAPYTP